MAKLPEEICNLQFEEAITSWDEAVPLGNGLLGSLLWGKGESYRMSVDRGDLWDNTPYPGIKSSEFCYAELVRLAKSGDTEKIRQIFDAPYYNATPTKLPAGKLLFNFGKCEAVRSRLRLATAEAEISFARPEGTLRLRSFLHAVERAGFVQIEGGAFAFQVERPAFGTREGHAAYKYDKDARSISDSLGKLSYPEPEYLEEGELSGFVQEISDGSAYGLLAAVRRGRNGAELCYTVACSFEGAGWLEDAKARVLSLLDRGYENAFQSHREWWERYWRESAVTLPEPLFEKNWYLTNYLLGSCSRKGCPPMPLQGVWTADNGELPPWKGDYHHDLNTQMSYYSYLKANHLEAGESFLDFLWDTRDRARQFARSFYGTQGLCLPAVMSLQGEPLGGWAMYSFSPTNQLWLCQLFERHYTYTGDRAFLENRAYPYMKETAEMILGLLETNGKGEYVLPVSSSPEIHDDTAEAWLTPNSNYDLAMLRYLFGKLSSLSRILENGEEGRWDSISEHLPELAADENGVLMLSPDEALTESHRHHAQAMAIHPLRLLKPEKPEHRKIIDATVLDLERLGTGWWVGYSFAWFAEFFAIQGNGEGAAHQLRTFWEGFCSPNGFHLNGDYQRRGLSTFHYRPFTLEGNMCAADALQEMLLQTEDGVTCLFPAIPAAWKRANAVSFERFRGERGMVISARMERGAIVFISLEPAYPGEYTFRGAFPADAGAKFGCPVRREGECLLLTLEGGWIYTANFKADR